MDLHIVIKDKEGNIIKDTMTAPITQSEQRPAGEENQPMDYGLATGIVHHYHRR